MLLQVGLEREREGQLGLRVPKKLSISVRQFSSILNFSNFLVTVASTCFLASIVIEGLPVHFPRPDNGKFEYAASEAWDCERNDPAQST